MNVDKFQSNLPLVDANGKPTPIAMETLAKLVAEVIALREEVDDHEARLVGGGL